MTLPLLLLGLACDSAKPPAATPATLEHPDVLLIVADALRADVLGAYGSPDLASPHLDRLSRAGATLTQVRTPSPWTLPAMASAFSGLAPHATGVCGQLDAVSHGVPLVAEEFTAKGYHTAAVSANYLYVSPKSGIGRGFQTFDVLTLTPGGDLEIGTGLHALEAIGTKIRPAPASLLLEHALAKWRTLASPRFLYLHLMDTHWRYSSELPDLDEPPMEPNLKRLSLIFLSPQAECRPRDAAWARWSYGRAVRSLDHFTARLLANLAWDHLRIVFTSDHGEAFFEHGRLSHGHSLYDELLRIPALVVEPGARPGLDARPRLLWGLRDLLLSGAWSPEPRLRAERQNRGWELAVLFGPYKIITGDRGACLFDLESDPEELYDAGPIPSDAPEWVQEVLATPWPAEGPVPRPLPATEEELRSLGYLP